MHAQKDLNLQPSSLESDALPIELWTRLFIFNVVFNKNVTYKLNYFLSNKFNHLHFPHSHPIFKTCRICKQKTGTSLEQLEQTRPAFPNFRSLKYWLKRPRLVYYLGNGEKIMTRATLRVAPCARPFDIRHLARSGPSALTCERMRRTSPRGNSGP